jgi:hypothetical protein
MADKTAATSSITPAAAVFVPTHGLPPGGLPAWDAPGASGPPAVRLSERAELVVDARSGPWAQVRDVNGWTGWVDGRQLQRRLPWQSSPAAPLAGSEWLTWWTPGQANMMRFALYCTAGGAVLGLIAYGIWPRGAAATISVGTFLVFVGVGVWLLALENRSPLGRIRVAPSTITLAPVRGVHLYLVLPPETDVACAVSMTLDGIGVGSVPVSRFYRALNRKWLYDNSVTTTSILDVVRRASMPELGMHTIRILDPAGRVLAEGAFTLIP